MVRQKDPFWFFADNLENGRRFRCHFCRVEFSGGISRFKWHLSGLKCHDIQVCDQVSGDIRLFVRAVLDTSKKKDIQVEYENCSVFPSTSGSRNLPNTDSEKDKYQLLDKQLAKWFFSFEINPKAIVSPIFKDFVKSIGEYGSSYQLPSPETLEEELREDVGKDAVEYVTNFRRDQVQASCTLMVAFGQIFGFSQTGTACLETYDNEHGGGNFIEDISSTINSFGPNRVLQLLLNNDCLYSDTRLKFEVIYPRINVSFCAAELIDDMLDHMKRDLRSTLGFVNLIFNTYYYYKPSSRGGLKIPRKADAFILLMLKSVLKMEDELQDVSFSSIIGSSLEVKELGDEQKKASCFICAKFLDYVISQKEFWSRVKLVAQVWVILFQTLCLVNHEDSNVGYLYQMMERLKDGIEKSREQDHFMFDGIWKTFCMFRESVIHPIHAVAAFFDPAYMLYMDNFEMNAEMRVGLDYMFENMIDSDEKEAFTMELEKYFLKLPELFTAQAITMLNRWHPRVWWEFCGKLTVPVLSKYAIRIVSQPCSNLFGGRYYDLLRGGEECEDEGPYPNEMGEGWIRRVNTMIMKEKSRSLKLEPIILDKLGEDLGSFRDTIRDTVYSTNSYIWYLSTRFTNDALVDCVINDSIPFSENVKNICNFHYDASYL